jgi:hypothetical protein
MASVGVLGFLKGASNIALDRLEARDKAEQEIKKAKMLEELRLSTNKELEDYKDLLESKNVDEDQSSIDLAGGKRILRNKKGETIGERGLTDTERSATQGSLDKLALDQEATRANIEQSKASAEASRASAGYSRVAAANYGKSKSGGLDAEDATDMDIANELLYRYKNEVTETAKTGNVSQPAIRQAAIAIVENSKTGEDAQRSFLEWLNRYRTGRAKTDQRARLDALDEQL